MNTVALIGLNRLIKKEADEILHGKGLLPVLEGYGRVHVTGSYALDLMAWRDLDIYLEVGNITEEAFFALGGKMATLLGPLKMSFRNETLARTIGLPDGRYWGIYLGDERNGGWKIDIWAINATECQRLLGYCAEIRDRLSPASSQQIMDIKSQCWENPQYRRSFFSTDIYTAVLERGISDMEGFNGYLKTLCGQSSNR